MILVIGGRGSGKFEYVASLGYQAEDMANAVLDGRPVVFNLQDMVFCMEDVERLLPELLKKQVVVCQEVGSGVIPATEAARTSRDAVGRLCVLLAQQAASVVRMVAGIPMAIKGR